MGIGKGWEQCGGDGNSLIGMGRVDVGIEWKWGNILRMQQGQIFFCVTL